MSFYLMPQVSYQTQQKLKKQAEDKKRMLESLPPVDRKPHRSSSIRRADKSAPNAPSSPHSVRTRASISPVSPSTPSTRRSETRASQSYASQQRKNSVSSTSLSDNDSIFSSASSPKSISKNLTNDSSSRSIKEEDQYDANDDLKSITSHSSSRSKFSMFSSKLSRSNTHTSPPKQKSTTYNYQFNNNLNELSKISKEVKKRGGSTISQPSMDSHSSHDSTYNNEDDSSLNLTRTISGASSIFSTKAAADKSLTGMFQSFSIRERANQDQVVSAGEREYAEQIEDILRDLDSRLIQLQETVEFQITCAYDNIMNQILSDLADIIYSCHENNFNLINLSVIGNVIGVCKLEVNVNCYTDNIHSKLEVLQKTNLNNTTIKIVGSK